MRNFLYISLFVFASFLFFGCENELTVGPDFSVTTEKTTYSVGEEIIFNIKNAPDWVTVYTGVEGKKYPDSYGQGIKSIVNGLRTYEYTYDNPGTYEVVFVGGVTNYKTDKKQVRKLTLTVE